jgi:hypothetical protein
MKVVIEKLKSLKLFGSRLPSALNLGLLVWGHCLTRWKPLLRLSLLQLLSFPLVLPFALYTADGTEGNPVTVTLLALLGIGGIVFVSCMTRPALIATIYMQIIGKDLKRHAALGRSFSVFWRYALILALMGILIGLGFELWEPLGFVAIVLLLFSEHALVLEDHFGIAAFRRSFELVRGRFWALFWRLITVGGILGLAAWLLTVVLSQIPMRLLYQSELDLTSYRIMLVPFLFLATLVSAASLPFFLTLQTILFAEVRKLKK